MTSGILTDVPVLMAVDERRVEGRPMPFDPDDTQRADTRFGPPDRRAQSAWENPTTWISLMSLLLAVCVAVGSVAAHELSIVSTKLDALTQSSQHYQDEIAQLRKESDKQDTVNNNQNAYNFDMSKSLTQVLTVMRLRGLDVSDIKVPAAPVQVPEQRKEK